MLVRTRGRIGEIEASAREEAATLRAQGRWRDTLLLSEPQIVVAWAAAADARMRRHQPDRPPASAPHRVLAFGTWLGPDEAGAMEHAVEALRARGESFCMTVNSLAGRPIEAEGRAIGGSAVLRLSDVSKLDKEELAELSTRHRKMLDDVNSLKALIEALPAPVWARDGSGQLVFANPAYAKAVEAKNAADAIERGLELLDRSGREDLAGARATGGAYRGRLPAVVAGARRTLDVLEIPTRRGGAGIGIDAAEAEAMRGAARSASPTRTAALSTSSQPASPPSAPTRS